MIASPRLASPGGRVINISSIDAQSGGGRPGRPAYADSNAGLHGLTYALARELAPGGITANAIAPRLHRQHWVHRRLAGRPTFRDRSPTPVGRARTPADVAGTVLWLASEAGSFVTGAIIPVSGGLADGVGRANWH